MKTLFVLAACALLAGCGDAGYVSEQIKEIHYCIPGERVMDVAGNQSFCPSSGISPY